MAKPPDRDNRLIRAAQALFVVNAVVWLALAAASLLRLESRAFPVVAGALVIAVLMAGNAFAMLLAGWGIGRRSRFWHLVALALLAVNIILTFTDQFGLLDFLTLLLDLLLASLLLTASRRFWPASPAGPGLA